ncbi:MAG: hypothetical protein ACRDTF_02065 [Pseudonocardiaceae bacterium]
MSRSSPPELLAAGRWLRPTSKISRRSMPPIRPRRAGHGFQQDLPQDRSFIGAVVEALAALLTEPDLLGPGRMVFFRR